MVKARCKLSGFTLTASLTQSARLLVSGDLRVNTIVVRHSIESKSSIGHEWSSNTNNNNDNNNNNNNNNDDNNNNTNSMAN